MFMEKTLFEKNVLASQRKFKYLALSRCGTNLTVKKLLESTLTNYDDG